MEIKTTLPDVDFELAENQPEHVQFLFDLSTQKMFNLGRRLKVLADPSPCGTGKTFTTCFLGAAQRHYYNEPVYLLITAPPSVHYNWRVIAAKAKLPIIFLDTYDGLRGKSGTMHHNYLMYVDEVFRGKKVQRIYHTTHLKHLVENHRVLVICDEVHKAKNKGTLQQQAVSELARAVNSPESKSTMLIMSGTIKDKPEQVFTLLKNMGIITAKEPVLYNPGTKEYIPTGLQQLRDFCYKIDASKTDEIYPSNTVITKHNKTEFEKPLFMEIMFPVMFHDMPHPPSTQHRYNMECYVDEQYRPALTKAIKDLHDSSRARVDANGQTTVDTTGNMGYIMNALRDIEFAKLPLFYRQVVRILEANKDSRVVVFLNYIASIDWLYTALEQNGYDHVATMKGQDKGNFKTKEEYRYMITQAFQSPNKKLRVLITNPQVGAEGISLHSTNYICEGGYNAYTLVSPNYKYTELAQLADRTDRVGTKEESYLLMIFGDTRLVPEESSIINAMMRKSDEVKELMVNNKNMILPGEYEKYVEILDEADFPENK